MVRYVIKGYASLNHQGKDYKEGEVVDLPERIGEHFKLPRATAADEKGQATFEGTTATRLRPRTAAEKAAKAAGNDTRKAPASPQEPVAGDEAQGDAQTVQGPQEGSDEAPEGSQEPKAARRKGRQA